MAAAVVVAYNILVPNKVHFQVDSDEDVVALKGTLRRVQGRTITTVATWNRAELSDGVPFGVDPDADRYELVVTATVNKNTTITGTTVCAPPPPSDDRRKPKLRKSEGLNERLWLFFPVHPEVS